MNNNNTTKVGNNENLISMEECLGDKLLTWEQLLEKLRMLTELLKKQEGEGIPQGFHGVHARENKDDAWERKLESRETVGMKTKNHEGGHMKARMMDVVRRIQKEQLEDDFEIRNASPLSIEILADSFLDKFKLPSLDKYNAKINSHSHLAIFCTTMLLQNINNMVLCRVFPSTFTRLAQKWYQHLSANSIHDFKELAYTFK